MIPRQRHTLIGLGIAALLSLALAGIALEQRSHIAAQTPPSPFLPGFAANIPQAARIEITAHDGAFAVVKLAGKDWVVPDRGNYPADADQVQRTLAGMASLQTIAPRTRNADWLRYIALDAPPQGNGVAITVKDARGTVLATLIAGNQEELNDGTGTTGLFVRRPGQDQAWLARGTLVPQGAIGDWLFSHILDIPATRLQAITMAPANGTGFTVGRAKSSDPVGLANTPKTGTPDYRLINDIGYAVANFSIVDAKPLRDEDFTKASRVTVRTFDGLVVTFDLAPGNDGIWARITATGAEAAAINAHTSGWEFKVPPQKGRVLLSDLARLMTPPPSAKPAP